VIKMWVEGE